MSSKSNQKILVVNDPGRESARPFESLGLAVSYNHDDVFTEPENIGLVVFTGGEDINPVFYGRSRHPGTHFNVQRDIEEVEIFQEAFENDIPMAGICRGAQFLCVMAGGVLVQDVTSHAGVYHNLRYKLKDGQEGSVMVNSAHHQMQCPYLMVEGDYEVLAWSEVPRSRHYIMDKETVLLAKDASANLRQEPDCVWYPKINALGMQFHPEWLSDGHPGLEFSKHLIELYIEPLVKARLNNVKRNG